MNGREDGIKVLILIGLPAKNVVVLVLSDAELVPPYLPSSACIPYDKHEVRYRLSMFDDDFDVYRDD